MQSSTPWENQRCKGTSPWPQLPAGVICGGAIRPSDTWGNDALKDLQNHWKKNLAKYIKN